MNNEDIIASNKAYWNDHADLWFGTTALPVYGVRFPTEDDLHLFGDVTGKKMLEICCGSGHSLKYNAQKGAGELWGVDLSQKQLDNAAKLLKDNGYSAKLICSKMEDELDVPKDYFDYVYSIYGIGWTTDLQGTFDKIASYCDIEDEMVKGMFGTIVQGYLKKGYNRATAGMMAREFFRYES